MNLLRDFLPLDEDNNACVIVETPAGSGVKLKYDPLANAFIWSRALSVGVVFPFDYGFVPRTTAEDNDAMDVLLLTDQGSYPGVVVPSRIVGALRVEQKRDGQPVKRNDRLLAVPVNDHRRSHIADVADISPRLLEEIAAFFVASLALTGKNIELKGWADAAEARQLLEDAIARYP